MINESKQAIKQVFDNFDKDKSGFVDQNELIAIAKELGQEMTQEDFKKLMATVDVNKDGKIAFQEFWDWWQYGKNGKLERMVFMKLKMMNLVKKVHSEFTRYGQSLIQKYEGTDRDNHYFAINFGETFGHVRVKTNFVCSGAGIKDQIAQYPQYELEEGNQIQVTLIAKSSNPEAAVNALQEVYDSFISAIKQELESGGDEELQFILPENGAVVKFTPLKELKEVSIQLTYKNSFSDEFLDDQYKPFLESLGPNNYLRGEMNVGLKNGFKKLIAKNLPFVKFLAEGFIAELSSESNSQLAKNIFRTLQMMLGDRFTKSQSLKSYFKKVITLPLLLKSSKFHITFKNMEDADFFLRSLGLSDLLVDQPTGRDIMYEIFQEEEVKDLKNPNNKEHIFYRFIKACQEHLWAQGSVFLTMPYQFVCSQYNIDGLYEFFNCLMRDDTTDEKKKK